MITFKYYQDQAKHTIPSKLGYNERLSSFGLGIAGEAGEVVEPIKKHLYHGKPLNMMEMKKELGDVLWYVAAIATTLGLTLEEIAEHNIQKLHERYPNGFQSDSVSEEG